jgi:hypothetical protein
MRRLALPAMSSGRALVVDTWAGFEKVLVGLDALCAHLTDLENFLAESPGTV